MPCQILHLPWCCNARQAKIIDDAANIIKKSEKTNSFGKKNSRKRAIFPLYRPICAGPASKWQAGDDGGDTGGNDDDDFTTDAKIYFSLWDEVVEEEEW